MLKLVERAYRVKDTHFINQWLPVFFGTLTPQRQSEVKDAFKNKTMQIILQNESDALIIF
jgi:hypothetical protein